MQLKVSELYLGFQNKIFEIFSKDLADRGIVYKSEIIVAKISITQEKNYFYLVGNLKTNIEYTCVRCLKKNPKRIDLPINILILEETMDFETRTNLDIIYFNKSNGYINMKNILADLIALAEPIQPLCNKNCAGLCPICGTEKTNFCNCDRHTNNGAWNKLKNLKF